MENVRDFLYNRLKNIVDIVETIKISFKYDSLTNDYLVKVIPKNEYELNKQYKKLEEELIFDFIEKYQYDSLVFLTEKEWIDIDNPDVEFIGNKFNTNQYNWFNDDNFLFDDLFINEISEFDDTLFDFDEKVSFSKNINVESKSINKNKYEIENKSFNFALAA